MTGKRIAFFVIAGALFALGYASEFPSDLMLSLAAGVFLAIALAQVEKHH
jgi:hypothetical protein